MGAATRTSVGFALAFVVIFTLFSRIAHGLWPGAVMNGFKILAALALTPALLGMLGESAVQGPIRPGACATLSCVLAHARAHRPVAVSHALPRGYVSHAARAGGATQPAAAPCLV
jgi:hypothetical protein